jgi:hypothetical protein
VSEIIDKYANKAGNTYLSPVIFLVLVVIILIFYFARYRAICKIDSDDINDDPELEKRYHTYTIFHCGLEALMCLIVSYFIIEITDANIKSYIINWVIAPAIGIFVSIYCDNKILMPFEDLHGGNPLNDKDHHKDDDKKSAKKSDDKISIIINPSSQQQTVSTSTGSEKGTLPSTVVGSPLPNQMEQSINNTKAACKKIFTEHEDVIIKRIEDLETSVANQTKDIDDIKEYIITDRKSRLTRVIYAALEQGYVKPKENAAILELYHKYTRLVGDTDHEVETLFKDQYLKLNVHEDRRKTKVEVVNDRRSKSKDRDSNRDDDLTKYI